MNVDALDGRSMRIAVTGAGGFLGSAIIARLREDGFHDIRTRMVCLSLADQLKLAWRDDDQVVLKCSDPTLPTGEENLVVMAVRALEKHTGKVFALTIELEKNIPSGAGLGGGSSDAAAVIRAINEMAKLNLSEAKMSEIAATIGSDIPFFMRVQV